MKIKNLADSLDLTGQTPLGSSKKPEICMRLKLSDLDGPREIRLSGREPWLAPVYEFLVEPRDPSLTGLPDERYLSGIINITPVSPQGVKVTGNVSMTPLLPCTRCGDSVPWAIREDQIQAFFATDDSLCPSDWDFYPISEDETISLVPLLHDTIQTQIPLRTVPVSPDGRSCLQCHADLDNSVVASSQGADQEGDSALARAWAAAQQRSR